MQHIRGFFDGSRRAGKTAYGWVAFGAGSIKGDALEEWVPIARKSGVLPETAFITAAELEGLSSLVTFLKAHYDGYEAALNEVQRFTCMDSEAIRILTLAEMV